MEGRSVTALSGTISGVVVVGDGEKSEGPAQYSNAVLECHICSKPPTDPVATSCGHVFCWPCVFSLVGFQRKRKPCPVCGTFLARYMNILPLYCGGAGSSDAILRASLANVVPPRPNNPRMFMPRFARVKGSDGSDLGTSGPMSVLEQIEQEIDNQKAQNERMVVELKREEDQMINDNAKVELLMQKKSQVVLNIARLEGQLA